MDAYKDVRKQFGNVGGEKVDYSFRMADTLGVKAISSSSTVTIARRVARFAEKYKMLWAGYGHDAIDDPEQFATPESYAKIISFASTLA
jgi:hypothetical protein